MKMDEIIYHWFIYKITSPSGRVYIGKTYNLKGRKRNYNVANCPKQKLLNPSLLKYGFSNHKFEIIEEFDSNIDFSSGKEIFWIRTYMSNKHKYPEVNGLNLTDGGEGTPGKRGVSPKKGKPQWNEAHKKRIGLSKVGNKNMLGKTHSNETRKKIAATRAIRYGNTPILVYDLNMVFVAEFSSKREAHRGTGVSRNVINNNLRGVTLNTPKLIFKYKE